MGTICSTLQWSCANCNLINAIEYMKCIQCGNVRKILFMEEEKKYEEETEKTLSEEEFCVTNTLHTLPGYVEINLDG